MSLDSIKIQLPISAESAIGSDISYSGDFEWLDTELMKVGSLAHESIEWDKVEQISWQILTTESKDFRVLSFLIQSLQQKNDHHWLHQSIELLKVFLEHFWEAFPYQKSGVRANKQRERFLTQLFTRLLQKVEDDSDTFQLSGGQVTLIQNLHALEDILKTHKIVLEEISALLRFFEKSQQDNRQESSDHESISDSKPEKTLTSHEKTSDLANHPTQYTLLQFLTVEKDRQFIERLITQAENNKEFLLAVMMRRILLWDGVLEIPLHDGDGETTLSAPSQEVISRSNRLLTKENVSLGDWQQLEASLMRAPFWLDAHRISALVARKVFSATFEVEIKQRLQALLQKLPQLKTLSFSNGAPYLSESTRQWLDEEVFINESSEAEMPQESEQAIDSHEMFYDIHLWNTYLCEAEIFYEQDGLTQSLHTLQRKIQQAENLREKVLWQLAISQIYRREGLEELATQNDRTIMTQIADIDLRHWEPQIFIALRQSPISEKPHLELKEE